MALRGDVSAADYTEGAISDPAILAFIPRINVSVDQEIEAMGPAFRHAARLVVRTIDGRTFRREIYHRRGSPENAVSRQDVERKFTSNVESLLGRDSIERLKELSSKLDVLPNADGLVKIMGAPLKSAQLKVASTSSVAEVD
jgi:aconitate decarboxylase